MSALRIAERQLADIVVLLHWVAHEIADPAVANHLRAIADELNSAAKNLRMVWELA